MKRFDSRTSNRSAPPGLCRWTLRAGTIAISLLLASSLEAQAVCETDYHPHDGGAKFRQVADFMVEQMRVNPGVALRERPPLPPPGGFWIPPGIFVENPARIPALLWWRDKVCSGCAWDHKKDIRPIIAPGEYTDIPGLSEDLYLDAWSNIHYSFVGIKTGFTEQELRLGANITDIREGHGIDEADGIWIGLGIELAEKYRPDQITAAVLIQAMLDTLPRVRGLDCSGNPRVRTIRPLVSVECFVFDDGYSKLAGPSDAIYFAASRRACIPDGTPEGTCRKWFGRCRTKDTGAPVSFKVFDNGLQNPSTASDAVYARDDQSVCVPGMSEAEAVDGSCRRWFGEAAVADGRRVECRLFDDGYTELTAATSAIYYRGEGELCLPDGSADGTCRKWFGSCGVR